MTRRILTLLGVAAVVMAVTVLSKLARVPVLRVAGQKATATTEATKAGPAPTTPWGEPDLQGIWREDYQVRYNDPRSMPGKSFLPTRKGPPWTSCEGPCPDSR